MADGITGVPLRGGTTYTVQPGATAFPAPELGILSRSRLAAPPLPLDGFGDWWAGWIGEAAAGANAPPDFVAVPLLAAASALIGNSRWARAWSGWYEPPALWCASVGNPSSGKSPGAAPIMRGTLKLVEDHMARDYPAELAAWEEAATIAATINAQWEADVKAAVKAGNPILPRPAEATASPRPVQPRVRVSDATVEALAVILAGLPRGVLHVRDELAGWLLNLQRYSGGSDRPFWLEAYVGGPFIVDRVKAPVPIYIPRLTVPLFGTIQPDKLEECLGGADDGLAGRILWTWPEPIPFRRPARAADEHAAALRLQRLASLTMPATEEGQSHPAHVSLDEDAAARLEAFARDMQDRETTAGGLLKSTIGKARGQALRLALVLALLRWCAVEDGPEPTSIDAPAMQAGVDLMKSYFLPMAERVLGDASIPVEERNARTLAEWIVQSQPAVVNVSAVRDKARLPGLRESDAVKAAVRFLADAGWLSQDEKPSGGRPRGDWTVNPRLWAAVA